MEKADEVNLSSAAASWSTVRKSVKTNLTMKHQSLFDIKYDVEVEEDCDTCTAENGVDETQLRAAASCPLTSMPASELPPGGGADGADAPIEGQCFKSTGICQNSTKMSITTFLLQFFCNVSRINFKLSDFARPFIETFVTVKKFEFFTPYLPPIFYPGWASYMFETIRKGTLSMKFELLYIILNDIRSGNHTS